MKLRIPLLLMALMASAPGNAGERNAARPMPERSFALPDAASTDPTVRQAWVRVTPGEVIASVAGSLGEHGEPLMLSAALLDAPDLPPRTPGPGSTLKANEVFVQVVGTALSLRAQNLEYLVPMVPKPTEGVPAGQPHGLRVSPEAARDLIAMINDKGRIPDALQVNNFGQIPAVHIDGQWITLPDLVLAPGAPVTAIALASVD